MKTRTLLLIQKHLESERMYFREDAPVIDYHLTNGEIRDIIGIEYGIRPKRSRIIKKYLKRIGNDLLRFVIEEYDGYQIKPQCSE